MIHADGIVCAHAGAPKATVSDKGGPVCAGGQPVTHACLDGKKVTIGEAWQSLLDAYGGLAQANGEGMGNR